MKGQRRGSTECVVVEERCRATAGTVRRLFGWSRGPCIRMTWVCRSDLDLPGEQQPLSHPPLSLSPTLALLLSRLCNARASATTTRQACRVRARVGGGGGSRSPKCASRRACLELPYSRTFILHTRGCRRSLAPCLYAYVALLHTVHCALLPPPPPPPPTAPPVFMPTARTHRHRCADEPSPPDALPLLHRGGEVGFITDQRQGRWRATCARSPVPCDDLRIPILPLSHIQRSSVRHAYHQDCLPP